MKEQIKKAVLAEEEIMIKNRRFLHMHPELSFHEKGTMDYICSFLEQNGIAFQKGIAQYGVVACIEGRSPGRCVALRADMDALPMTEENEQSYISQNKGIMHACGHDGHTAILLSVCKILHDMREHFAGTVKCIFQPGEETTGGAKPMIDEGVLDNPKVDVCAALHMDAELETGKMRIKPGSMYASPDDFEIEIIGKGGHGAEPHRCVDPILTAAQIVMQIQSIVSRSLNPFEQAVVTVGSIHGGDATNIIPDRVKITGTARAMTEEVRDLLRVRIEEITKSICAATGANYRYEFIKLYPPLINHEQVAQDIYAAAEECLGKKSCIYGGEATMAGEDFAYFAKEVPAALFKLGCANKKKGIIYPIHSTKFDIDESCLKYGAMIFLNFVLRFLDQSQEALICNNSNADCQ